LGGFRLRRRRLITDTNSGRCPLLVNQQLRTTDCLVVILFITGAPRQRIDKMRGESHGRIGPVCKFGPGGDFVTDWPGCRQESDANEPNALARLLATLGAIINNVVGCQFQPESFTPKAVFVSGKRFPCRESNEPDGAAQGYFNDKAACLPGSSVQVNGGLSRQRLLFSDDWAGRSRAGHKPKHHIRAHQRPSRKRPAAIAGDQGTLFDTDLKSARSA